MNSDSRKRKWVPVGLALMKLSCWPATCRAILIERAARRLSRRLKAVQCDYIVEVADADTN